MTLEFTRPDIGGNVTMNTLLYGGAKVGKSARAGTAPPGVLYLNADLPNATRYVHASNPNGSIMELKLPSYDDGSNAPNSPTLALMNEVEIALADPKQSICKSVVVDPTGELHRRLREELSHRAIRPSQNVYGDVAAHIERFCRHLCELPHINVVIVCHETTMKDEASGEILRIPFTGTQQGSPSQSQTLMGMVDVVGYCGVAADGEGKRHFRTQLFPGRGRHGGDRFNCLGGVREDGIADWVKVVRDHERELVSTLKQTGDAETREDSTPVGEAARPPEGTPEGAPPPAKGARSPAKPKEKVK